MIDLETVNFQKTSPAKTAFCDDQFIADGVVLRFGYTNHNGEPHEYVVRPETIELGTYDGSGHHPDIRDHPDNLKFVLNAKVVYRDGEEHPGGYLIRRTFLIEKMHHVRVENR